ncbi:hypothetical protein ACHAW5_007458 [Stephanodiscus triporus]|uniref:Uncharacterized protein n=1 Tax=Stephanodiscus triporus TaxID=2934178 RepID=A0ABD3NHF8_9STRA
MLLFAQMKHSLLALQIGLWFHPGAVGALVLTTEPKNRHRGRRFKGSLSSSLMGQSSVASPVSLSSSNDNLVESLPVIRRHQRHSVFSETNVVSKFMPFPHRELCRRSLPTPPPSEVHQRKPNRRFWEFPFHLENENEKRHDAGPVSPLLRKDVRVQFDDPTIGAHQLLERCGVIISKNDERSHLTSETITAEETETVEHLASVLSFFQSVAAAAESPSGTSNNVKCMARIVSTVGSSGVKCPRWHADHVPVRLVMSILGPGCDYIQENISTEESRRLPRIVNRRALNSLDVDDTMKANDIIVPPSLLYKGRTQGEGSNSIIKHAREGEAVLLMGRKWEDEPAAQPPELEDGDALYSNLVLAAVHRSPTLMPYQERILLTVDLVD